MTGEECREAPSAYWTRFEISTATNVPLWFIAALEDGKATPDFLVCYEIDLRAALELAGVEFIAENDGGAGREAKGKRRLSEKLGFHTEGTAAAEEPPDGDPGNYCAFPCLALGDSAGQAIYLTRAAGRASG